MRWWFLLQSLRSTLSSSFMMITWLLRTSPSSSHDSEPLCQADIMLSHTADLVWFWACDVQLPCFRTTPSSWRHSELVTLSSRDFEPHDQADTPSQLVQFRVCPWSCCNTDWTLASQHISNRERCPAAPLLLPRFTTQTGTRQFAVQVLRM